MRILALLPLLTLVSGYHHHRIQHSFNITKFTVPALVQTSQPDVELSCYYEGNFTMLQIFKGNSELFRFKPSTYPAVRSFPVNGIGLATTNNCGSSACHIQLNNITENATGSYSCDLEHESPPYLYTRMSGRMEVRAPPRRMPYIDGFAAEYGDGEEMQAICRIEPGSMVRWFINGDVVLPLYGSRIFKYTSEKSLFVGEPPAVNVQCLEDRGLATLGSKIVVAVWVDRPSNNTSIQHELSNETVPETMKVSGNKTNAAMSVVSSLATMFSLLYFLIGT